MKSYHTTCRLLRLAGLSVALVVSSSQTFAATIWDGPLITYTQPGFDPTLPANQDPLTANVIITRAQTAGIFNAHLETAYTKPSSPADTEWAVGNLADALTLTYATWQQAGGGRPVLNLPDVQLVCHLITDDIYLSVKFTALGRQGAGGFSYIRSTPNVSSPTPTVSITNPVNGATFAAPANIAIAATASVSSGSVTNVAFFANSTSLGSVQSPPFTINSGALSPGGYALSAVATAGGILATSSVVNVSVVSPIAITSTAPAASAGQFSFDYSANPGLRYVVERSTDLINWQAVITNTAASNPVHFADNISPAGRSFYRVGRLPNP
jgi:hypothetical protein